MSSIFHSTGSLGQLYWKHSLGKCSHRLLDGVKNCQVIKCPQKINFHLRGSLVFHLLFLLSKKKLFSTSIHYKFFLLRNPLLGILPPKIRNKKLSGQTMHVLVQVKTLSSLGTNTFLRLAVINPLLIHIWTWFVFLIGQRGRGKVPGIYFEVFCSGLICAAGSFWHVQAWN